MHCVRSGESCSSRCSEDIPMSNSIISRDAAVAVGRKLACLVLFCSVLFYLQLPAAACYCICCVAHPALPPPSSFSTFRLFFCTPVQLSSPSPWLQDLVKDNESLCEPQAQGQGMRVPGDGGPPLARCVQAPALIFLQRRHPNDDVR